MKYTMTTPCHSCPFRSDIPAFVTAGRMREIIECNAEFQCHKTVDYGDVDDDGELNERRDEPNAQHCAGLLILLEKMERPHQMMRIMERLGAYDARKLDMAAPVYGSPSKAIAACKRKRKTAAK